jgi:hypothetical protein
MDGIDDFMAAAGFAWIFLSHHGSLVIGMDFWWVGIFFAMVITTWLSCTVLRPDDD